MKLGKVVETFSAVKGKNGLPRPRVENLHLIKGYGIEGDKFAGMELEQTVLIIGLNSYKIAKDSNIYLEYGSYGENILLDFDPHSFVEGDRFKIGDSIIEITQKCTLCNHLSIFSSKLPKLIRNHRGLYCKIVQSGSIVRNQDVIFDMISKRTA